MQEYFQRLLSALLSAAFVPGAPANLAQSPFRLVDSSAIFSADETPAAKAEAQIPGCPDADGLLRGRGRLVAAQTVTEVEITGYVTDAAELSHFDLAGATTGTLSGGGRAGRISVSVAANKIGADRSADRLGRIAFGETDSPAAEILKAEADAAVKAIFAEAAGRFRAARDEWRGGACVEVRLTAAKTKLMPGEKIAVAAESRQKQENVAIDALLKVKSAAVSAAPATLRGTPRAVFTLTAPPRGTNASIVIELVSRRGIGTGRLEFPQDAAGGKNPPAKPGRTTPPIIDPKREKTPVKCKSGGWYGTISLETKIRRDKQSGAGGSRPTNAVDYKEKVYKIDYQVFGQRDASLPAVNAFVAEAKVYYSDKHYRSMVYRPHKCLSAGNRIYDVPELKQEYVNRSEARGAGRVTIYISAYERNGSFQLFAPKALGESFYEQAFSSACPTTDEPNTYRRPGKPFEWQFGGLLVEFVNENPASGVLSGSRTTPNADGSETTVVWNLKRDCR